jgi:hypothetical protein
MNGNWKDHPSLHSFTYINVHSRFPLPHRAPLTTAPPHVAPPPLNLRRVSRRRRGPGDRGKYIYREWTGMNGNWKDHPSLHSFTYINVHSRFPLPHRAPLTTAPPHVAPPPCRPYRSPAPGRYPRPALAHPHRHGGRSPHGAAPCGHPPPAHECGAAPLPWSSP